MRRTAENLNSVVNCHLGGHAHRAMRAHTHIASCTHKPTIYFWTRPAAQCANIRINVQTNLCLTTAGKMTPRRLSAKTTHRAREPTEPHQQPAPQDMETVAPRQSPCAIACATSAKRRHTARRRACAWPASHQRALVSPLVVRVVCMIQSHQATTHTTSRSLPMPRRREVPGLRRGPRATNPQVALLGNSHSGPTIRRTSKGLQANARTPMCTSPKDDSWHGVRQRLACTLK